MGWEFSSAHLKCTKNRHSFYKNCAGLYVVNISFMQLRKTGYVSGFPAPAVNCLAAADLKR